VVAWTAAGDPAPLLSDLRRRVREGDVERSARAIRALVKLPDASARKALRDLALAGGVPASIRSIALSELAKAGKGLDRDDLLKLLEEAENVDVVRAAVLALGRMDEEPVANALHERFLIEENVDVRRTILSSLRGMTADAVFPALVDAVRDEVPGISEDAVAELEKRTGKDFGHDADRWEAWVKETFGDR
jgi:HEAT repeat protein